MDGVNAHVDEQISVIKAILQNFQVRLEAGDSARHVLEKNVEQGRFSATSVKGRVGALEAKIKGLEAELSAIEVEKDDHHGDGFSRLSESKVNKLHEELSAVRDDIRDLKSDVKAQGAAIGDLQTNFGVGANGASSYQVTSHSSWGTSDLDAADFTSEYEENPTAQTEAVSHY